MKRFSETNLCICSCYLSGAPLALKELHAVTGLFVVAVGYSISKDITCYSTHYGTQSVKAETFVSFQQHALSLLLQQ